MTMNNLGRSSVLAVALGAAAVTGAQAQDDAKFASIAASHTIRVGITETSPPWTVLGSDNKPAGYDVEIAKEVGKRIGAPNVVFIADSFKNFLEGLRSDKYDLVFNDLTPTPEREKLVDFAEPYGVEDFRIFVKAGNTAIKSVDDLKGKTVGATTGSTNESWARAHLTSSTVKGYENGSFLFQDLGFGRIDATIISHFGGLRYAQATNLGVVEVGPPLTYQLSAPALAKGEPKLKALIDKAIRDMIADGTVDALAQKMVGRDYKMSEAVATAEREAAAPQ